MIKIALSSILLSLSLYGANILNYNIYDRSDRVDVMITFDSPYSGTIRQSIKNSKIVIKLEDAKIESSKIKRLSTDFLKSIAITPMLAYTQVVASIHSKVHLIASKTSDGYGLRLRFTKTVPNREIKTPSQKIVQNDLSALPTKKGSDISTSYYVVITLLIFGIILLLIFKKKITNAKETKSLLFDKKTKPKESVAKKDLKEMNDVSIKFQKDINSSNSVIMIDFDEQSYLVLMGSNNNILLDRFHNNKPISQEDFESLIETKSQELDEFLKVEQNNTHSNESLKAYKERAASIMYSNENQ